MIKKPVNLSSRLHLRGVKYMPVGDIRALHSFPASSITYQGFHVAMRIKTNDNLASKLENQVKKDLNA